MPNYTPLILFTGAGASSPFNLPTMRNFTEQLAADSQMSTKERALLRTILQNGESSIDPEPTRDVEVLLTILETLSDPTPNGTAAFLTVWHDNFLNRLLRETNLTLDKARQASPAFPSSSLVAPAIDPERSVLPAGWDLAAAVGAGALGALSGINPVASLKSAFAAHEVVSGLERLIDVIKRQKSYLAEEIPSVARKLSVKIMDAIINTYSKPDTAKLIVPFDDLRSALTANNLWPPDIFTVNYDPCVESYCDQCDLECQTGFRSSRWLDSFSVPRKTLLRLFKLHGSVTWYKGSDGVKESPSSFGNRKTLTMDGPAESAVLYPIHGKASFAEPYLSLLLRFRDALREAGRCIAIGYSFRDPTICDLFLDGMRLNNSLRIQIVDPELNEERLFDRAPGFAVFAERLSFHQWVFGEECDWQSLLRTDDADAAKARGI